MSMLPFIPTPISGGGSYCLPIISFILSLVGFVGAVFALLVTYKII